MVNQERFDVLILGSGTGGTSLALHLADVGQRVAIVERRWVGGACPNTNCLPSKNEIWSAKIVSLARQYAESLRPGGMSIAVDMGQVRHRKRSMVAELNAAVVGAFKASDVTLIMGHGRFIATRTVEIALNAGGSRTVTADRVFLNLGTRAAIPDVPGLAAAGPMTNIDALDLGYLPSHLVVLGGGYVGLELAQAFRRFGSGVTLLEQGPQLVGHEDPDVGAEIANVLTEEGVDVVTMAETVLVGGRSGPGVQIDVRCPSGMRAIVASDLLVASGRIPNTTGIGLEIAGVNLDDHGYVAVGERLETSATDVWAIGECAGGPQFTHVSFDDFRVLRDNLAGGSRTTRDRLVPYCVFTDPPIVRVGLNESEAQSRGISVRVARLPIASVLRAKTTGETTGFMKLVVDMATDCILGFTIIGSEAGEVAAVIQTAMMAGLPYTAMRDIIFVHPTMAEGLIALMSNVPPRPTTAAV